MRTVIIYGPPGSGKTTHAEALMKHFGCSEVVDEFMEMNPTDLPTLGALHLTSLDRDVFADRWRGVVEVYSIDEARERLRMDAVK